MQNLRSYLLPFGLGLMLLIVGTAAKGQSLDSDSTAAYRFLVGGHLYGSGYNQVSVFPSAALYANVETINAREPSFFMGLGDIVRDGGSPLHWQKFGELTDRISSPFLNAPGNHDLLDRNQYAKAQGKSFFHFRRGQDVFLVLDTEEMIYPVDSLDQEAFVESVFAEWDTIASLRNVFIFSHRLIWALERPEFAEVDRKSNMSWAEQPHIDFLDDLMPRVKQLSAKHPVWWFSGDVGTPFSFPLFYEQDPAFSGITYIATGMGNGQWDALVEVAVDENGEVKMEPLPLCGQEMQPIESYNRAYLAAESAELPIETTPSLVQKMARGFKALTFWLGILGGALGLSVLWGAFRVVQKRGRNK